MPDRSAVGCLQAGTSLVGSGGRGGFRSRFRNVARAAMGGGVGLDVVFGDVTVVVFVHRVEVAVDGGQMTGLGLVLGQMAVMGGVGGGEALSGRHARMHDALGGGGV